MQRSCYSFSVFKFVLLYFCIIAYIVWLIQYVGRSKRGVEDMIEISYTKSLSSSWALRSNDGFEYRTVLENNNIQDHSFEKRTRQDKDVLDSSPYIAMHDNGDDVTMHDNGDDDFVNNYEDIEGVESRGRNVFKTIALYDPHNVQKNFLKNDAFQKCQYKNCIVTKDVESADAVVIFVMPKLDQEPKFKRRTNQVWVFYTIEAPLRATWFDILDDPVYRRGFNLTVTFKLDSDIPNIYGKLFPVSNNTPKKNYGAIFRNKSKMVAWFVSNCKARSQRGKFVERMRTRIHVDIFGGCGTKVCGYPEKLSWGKHQREKTDEVTCFPMLSSDYKFYLAFENSLCSDYVTEKFFKLFQNVDVIPVVRGGADYHKHFPSGMYVDASDFSTPESLADFLLDLAEDEERYVGYLSKKDKYGVSVKPNLWKCGLCEKLHTMDHVTYTDIRDWWTRDSCYDPRDAKPVW